MRSIAIIIILFISLNSVAQNSKKLLTKSFLNSNAGKKPTYDNYKKSTAKKATQAAPAKIPAASKQLTTKTKGSRPDIKNNAKAKSIMPKGKSTKGQKINTNKISTSTSKKQNNTASLTVDKRKKVQDKAPKNYDTKKKQAASIKRLIPEKKNTKYLQKSIQKQLKLFAKAKQAVPKKSIVQQKKTLSQQKIQAPMQDAQAMTVDIANPTTPEKQYEKKSIVQKVNKVASPVLFAPFLNEEDGEIFQHFGRIKISNVYYNNTSVTYVTDLGEDIYSTIDSAVVSEISYNEDSVATIFLKYDQYTVILDNLQQIKASVGDVVSAYTPIATVAADEMHREYGSIELMLMKGNKILNPEKFMKKRLSNVAAPVESIIVVGEK
jgi:murein DD-endopeptidase MepM/ murein hydrolase activator NlpD